MCGEVPLGFQYLLILDKYNKAKLVFVSMSLWICRSVCFCVCSACTLDTLAYLRFKHQSTVVLSYLFSCIFPPTTMITVWLNYAFSTLVSCFNVWLLFRKCSGDLIDYWEWLKRKTLCRLFIEELSRLDNVFHCTLGTSACTRLLQLEVNLCHRVLNLNS